jgi:hypothetical protein
VKRGRRIPRITTTRNPIVALVRRAAIGLAPASALALAFLLAGRSDPHRALRSFVP